MVIEISFREYNLYKEILFMGFLGFLFVFKIVLVFLFVNFDIKKKVMCFYFIYYKCVCSY